MNYLGLASMVLLPFVIGCGVISLIIAFIVVMAIAGMKSEGVL